MKLTVLWIGKNKEPAIQSLTADYLARIGHYARVEEACLKDEAGLQKYVGPKARTPHFAVLLDSAGRQFSSEELARFLEQYQERNSQPLLFAIGGASGFSRESCRMASMLLSLGRLTYAHELARVVLLEQIYRAFTIIKGHPYHLRH